MDLAEELGLTDLAKLIKEKEKEEPEPRSSLDDWIKLNADGTIFNASRATLINAGSGYGLLTKMFDPTDDDYCPPPRDSNGAYLIDCNPQIFSVFREMLRSNDFERCSGITKENFKAVDTACQRFIGLSLSRLDFFDYEGQRKCI